MRNTASSHPATGLLKAGVAILLFLCAACSGKDGVSANYLVRLGGKTLTADDLRPAIPAGLAPEDSIALVRSLVSAWIESNLINEVASDEVDMDEIDRLTEMYRNSLIRSQYRRKMFLTHADSIPEDSVRAYYDAHKSDFILERPLVKGVYLKVPDDAANLRVLRRLYRSDKPADIDRLEKEVLSSAIHYDYFRDRWVDWEQIENRIPYPSFGTSADTWLNSNSVLEYSAGSFTYLLYITGVIHTGAPMPVENARSLILDRLMNMNRKEYDKRLSRELYDRAIKDGRLDIRISI